MSVYNNKYRLDDFFNDNSILPQFALDEVEQLKGKEVRKYKKGLSKEKGEFNSYSEDLVNLVYQIALNGAYSDFNDVLGIVADTTIEISGNLKRRHTTNMAVKNIYNNLNTYKGMLSQIISNYSMLREAIDYSRKLTKKPRLYLTLTSIRSLKNLEFFGNKTAARTKLMTEIMQNLYFNDAFKPLQEKYGIRQQKIIRDRNILRNYDYEKERWEKRVGIK